MKNRHLATGLLFPFAFLFTGTLTASGIEEARKEAELALSLEPDIENGKELYKICLVCHTPEGWGSRNGYYPQIAGQLPTVIIKQLADIRARNRDNPTMFPFAMPSSLGGAQEMTDVAAYISTLPVTPSNNKGRGNDLALGKLLYEKECAECHGREGEGDSKDHIPLVRGQHYSYLLRQFRWIRIGKRRNADKKMVKQIRNFSGREVRAVLDYVSRMQPPADKVAEPSWTNPDFPKYARVTIPAYLEPSEPSWPTDRTPPARLERPDWATPPEWPAPPERPARAQ
jgi:cytochrome c553